MLAAIPDHGNGRPDDRRGACDGREMVAPEHDPVCRDVVEVIPHSMGRCLEIRIELIDFLGYEFRVELIADEERPQTDSREKYCTHVPFPLDQASRTTE